MLAVLEKIVGVDVMREHILMKAKVTRWNSDPNIRGAYSYAKIGENLGC